LIYILFRNWGNGIVIAMVIATCDEGGEGVEEMVIAMQGSENEDA
jgi:hypothetical protein